jgi:hypothetical protein
MASPQKAADGLAGKGSDAEMPVSEWLDERSSSRASVVRQLGRHGRAMGA